MELRGYGQPFKGEGRRRRGGGGRRGGRAYTSPEARERELAEWEAEKANEGWAPRVTGTTDDGHEVTLREGLGDNEGHTLIADGQQSDRSFRRGHNHYGPKREGGGRVEDDGGDRGHYTGPGH